MSTLLENLNPEQLEAVTFGQGPLLIVAGAGTGKTTVITRRIAWLIEQKLAKPDEILALTFTDKAATEMEERLDQLVPLGSTDFWISTFHGFCERLLKLHALDAGLPGDFTLLDDTKQWVLLHKQFHRFELDYYKPLGNPTKFISALLDHFSRCKDELITPAEYQAYATKLKNEPQSLLPDPEQEQETLRISELAHAYETYQKILLEQDALDFGDLITYAIYTLQKRANILKHYQTKFKYILVDEFQDTNVAQYELVKLLAGTGSQNLTVVGDDDQSIYKFRGASVSNILKFKDDFPKAKNVTLTANYRSGQKILDTAYTSICHNNPDRLEVKLGINKQLTNPLNDGGVVSVLEGTDLQSEFRLVVEKIIELKTITANSSWNDFAILVRSKNSAEGIAPKLEAAGIPFTFYASTGLYEKALIGDLVSYLKLLDNYHESSSLYRILNFPKFALPAIDIAHLTQFKTKRTLSLYETLQNEDAVALVSETSRQKITELLQLLDKHTQYATDHSVVEVFVTALSDLGVPSMLEAETLENAQNREFLEQFYRKVETFEENKPATERTTKQFLTELDLELQAGDTGHLDFDPQSGPESVKILTVHGSKGLEFKTVFIINLVDQRFPTREKGGGIELPEALIKDILPEGDAHLQEERRLFYVAVTRAKERVYFTWSKDYGGSRPKKPSQFLQELGLVTVTKTTTSTGQVNLAKAHHTGPEVYQDIPKRFSYSAINTFKNCPLEYKYAHYLKLPLPGTGQMSFGVTIHTTLEKYLAAYQRDMNLTQMGLFNGEKAPTLPSFEILESLYNENWVDEWYTNKADKAKHREKGLTILQNFYQHCLSNPPQPKHIEKKFVLPLGEYEFVGKIDRADSTPEGLAIFDYKTGKKPGSKSGEDLDQLKIYQWAAEDELQEPVASLCYWYLGTNEFTPVPLASKDELITLQEKLLATIHEIVNCIRYDKFAELHKAGHIGCRFTRW